MASSGKLRLIDDLTTTNKDETGFACIKGSDISNIQSWVLNSAKTGYDPAECLSGFTLRTLKDGVTKACIPDDVITYGYGCSSFDAAGSNFNGFVCATCTLSQQSIEVITTTSKLNGAIKACIPKIVVDNSIGCAGKFIRDLSNFYEFKCDACPNEISYYSVKLQIVSGKIFYGCTSVSLPNVDFYKRTTSKDSYQR